MQGSDGITYIGEAKQGWEDLYNQYSRKMYGVCLRYARNADDAKDILHDGFLKVFKCLHEYKGTGSFEGWIRRIMVHTAINTYRLYNSRWFFIEDNTEIDTPDEITIEDNISYEELIKHINALPDGYRIVFNMYVIEGYKHQEIAQMLGISESTSKTQLLKARKLLTKRLGVKNYEKVY
ncbi:MAG: RNA polymerase sigma factor [Bacteroidales bacterium]|nr:RNA polymerase sigma factor [Bacteroidales bacterium]